MKKLRLAVVIVVALGAGSLAGVPGVASASAPPSAPAITEFSVSPGSAPRAVATGADGNLWFTSPGGTASIGRLTPQGVVTLFSIGLDPAADPVGITAGPDGALWFTEPGVDRIGRIALSGTITEFPVTAGSGPRFITAGADGNLWFTESTGHRVGKITTSGSVTEYSAGITAGAQPWAITAGPDGAVWFTELTGNRIGRITTGGTVTEYSSGITPSSSLFGITTGSDGNLWFTESVGNRIGRITQSGRVTEFSAGITPAASPTEITAGPDGNLWFTEAGGNRIGRITTGGAITEFSNGLTGASSPFYIVGGPDGALWFSEFTVDKIGRITTDAGSPQFSSTGVISIPTSGTPAPYPSTITVAGLANRRITDVTVQLTGVSHGYLSDLDVLLVGPHGQKILLMSDLGVSETSIAGQTFRFTDSAALGVPLYLPVSGTYLPTNLGVLDALPAPAPAEPYGSTLSAFYGTGAEGSWQLFVNDDTADDGGVIASWGLSFETEPVPTPVLTGTSAASATQVSVIGSAEAGSSVALFADAACTVALGTGSAAALAVGIPVTVPANAVTNIYARSTDVAGNVSACSASHATVANASAVSLSVAPTPYGVGAVVGVTVAGATGTVSVAGSSAVALVGSAASVRLSQTLPVGTNAVTLSYSGDASHAAASVSIPVTIVKASVKASFKVTKKPTPKKAGKATVTVTSASGGLAPSGKVTVTFSKKGAKSLTVKKSFSSGKAAIAVPKLKKGTWTVSVAVGKTANYTALATKKVGTITVK